jgi:hypothetical protein
MFTSHSQKNFDEIKNIYQLFNIKKENYIFHTETVQQIQLNLNRF